MNLVAENNLTAEKSLGQRLVANTLFNFIGQFYVLLLGIVVVPYMVHRLGAELYGLITIVAALGGFAGLLNLGMGRALSKHVSALRWRGDLQGIRALFQTALAVSLLAGATGCLLLIGFRGSLSAALFHGDTSTDRYVAFAVFMTGFGVLLSMLTESLSALPIAFQRFDIYNRINVLVSTLRNLGAVLVLALGLYFKGILLVYVFSSLVGVLCYVHYARQLVTNLSLRPRFVWGDFKKLFSFSASVLVAGVSALAVHRLDRLLVAYFLPIAAVAFYVIPYSLAEKTSLGVGNITSVIFPTASELSSMKAHDKLRELYLRATKMVLLAGIPVTVILLAVPGPVLRHWVGPEFALRGTRTLQLLAGGFFFNILAYVPFVVAQGIGRPGISAKYSLFNGIANIILFLLLIPRLGIVGAGAGFLISEGVVMPIFIWEVNRILHISWFAVVSQAYLRPLACGFGMLSVLLLFRSYVDSVMKLTLLSSLALGVFATLALLGAIDRRERNGLYEQTLHVFRWGGSTASM